MSRPIRSLHIGAGIFVTAGSRSQYQHHGARPPKVEDGVSPEIVFRFQEGLAKNPEVCGHGNATMGIFPPEAAGIEYGPS